MEIKTIQGCAKGMNIDKVEGIITRVGEKKSGTHKEYGDWTFQPITLKDETGEIGVTLNNQVFEPKKGDKITITAMPSEKHGLVGIKIDIFDDKKQLKVTKTATITTGETKPESTPETKEKPKEAPKEPTREPIVEDKPDWANINLRKDRSMCIAYAKDLAVAGKIEVIEILNQAERFVRYVNAGIPKLTPDQIKQIENDANDEEIPF